MATVMCAANEKARCQRPGVVFTQGASTIWTVADWLSVPRNPGPTSQSL
jgi:hypothetical protein